jgi:hypothetical protein
MRALLSLLTALLTLAASASALAHTVRLDYRDLRDIGSQQTVGIIACGFVVAGSGVASFTGTGIGIFGGALDDRMDPGESVGMTVGAGDVTTALAYRVTTAINLGGTSAVGEHFLEGFDANGDSLGVVPRSGIGWQDATALFDDAVLSRIEITSGPDAMRIGEVEYELMPGDDAFVSFISLASDVALEIQHCGLRVTSSSGSVGVLQGDGIYAWSAAFDAWTHPGESLDIEFDAPVLVSYFFDEVGDDDGDFREGEHFVQAFGAEGNDLGIRSAEGTRVDLTEPAFFGAVPLSRIVLTAVDRHRLDAVEIVPEPAVAGPLAAFVALALLARRRPR